MAKKNTEKREIRSTMLFDADAPAVKQRGLDFSDSDLDNIAAGGRCKLSIGHLDPKNNPITLGDTLECVRVGRKIFGDLAFTPSGFAAARDSDPPANQISVRIKPDFSGFHEVSLVTDPAIPGAGFAFSAEDPTYFFPFEFAEASLDDRTSAVRSAVYDRCGDDCWCTDVFDDYAIYVKGQEYFQVPYSVDSDGNILLGTAFEVERKFVPASDSDDGEELKMSKLDDETKKGIREVVSETIKSIFSFGHSSPDGIEKPPAGETDEMKAMRLQFERQEERIKGLERDKDTADFRTFFDRMVFAGKMENSERDPSEKLWFSMNAEQRIAWCEAQEARMAFSKPLTEFTVPTGDNVDWNAHLSPGELAFCKEMGTEPADYLREKRKHQMDNNFLGEAKS